MLCFVINVPIVLKSKRVPKKQTHMYSQSLTAHTMITTRKTREQRNAERVSREKSRRMPRVTEGNLTFEKATLEVQARDFVILDGAEDYWNKQTCYPSRRKMRVIHHGSRQDVPLCNILKGNTMSSKPTATAKQASYAKQSATITARNLGQKNWMEGAGIKAAMRVLDPKGLLEIRPLPDGLGPDFLLRPSDSTEDAWVPVQMKTAEAYDGPVGLNVERKDGLPGGKYGNMVIVGAILEVDETAAKETMKVFGAIPEAEVTELFLYASASDMHCGSLQPYPRREQDDLYGDNRYVLGFDDPQRLVRMEAKLWHLVQTMSKVTYEDACCAFGPGSLNVALSKNHKEEVLNLRALAQIVGMDSLEAPALQNLTTDIIWKLDVKINISLKTVSFYNDGHGYYFTLSTAPYAEHCHVVMAFYREGTIRTHVSVICASRAYVPDRECFCWSATNNTDVLDDRIDLRQPDALEKVHEAVAIMFMD